MIELLNGFLLFRSQGNHIMTDDPAQQHQADGDSFVASSLIIFHRNVCIFTLGQWFNKKGANGSLFQ